jgi:hypothetical protein
MRCSLRVRSALAIGAAVCFGSDAYATRAAGPLRSSDGHCGGARRNCRWEAMQWAVGLPVCPLALSAMLDVA